MSDLQTFREETRSWLEANCPPEMRKPGDVAWGGRNAQFSHPDQEVWLQRMGEKGWTCPTWPSEYGGGGLSKEENKILQEEIIRLKKWQTLAVQNSRENKVLKKLLLPQHGIISNYMMVKNL